MLLKRSRVFIATLLASATIFAATVPASAQQAGLVNVSVGNVNVLNHVGIGVAANVVAQICGVSVGPVAVLATQVAATGAPNTVCTTGPSSLPVTITA